MMFDVSVVPPGTTLTYSMQISEFNPLDMVLLEASGVIWSHFGLLG